jgi:hypothetical protein
MEGEGRHNHESVGNGLYLNLIYAMYRIVGQVEKRFDALRATDIEAVKLAHADLSKRLEGFPQQYATKTEMEQATAALQKLEKIALSHDVYDQNHKVLIDAVTKLDKEKLNSSVYDTFVDNYRMELQRAAAERRDVAEVLAAATEKVRQDILEERGEFLTQDSFAEQHRTLVVQIESVEKWQYKIAGGLVFATFIAPLVTGLVVYIFTKEF